MLEVSLFCPYCARYTAVTPATLSLGTIREPKTVDTRTHGMAHYQTDYGSWWVGQCNACKRPLLLAIDGPEVYPTPRPPPSNEHIPEHIRRDLDEAKRCMTVAACRACVAMARRAMQAACLFRGAEEKKLLYQQIDELAANGKITADLREWAHEVRYLGNDGAHPPKDHSADLVSEDDANDALELAEQFLEVLFVTPALAAARGAKRKSKGPVTPPTEKQ